MIQAQSSSIGTAKASIQIRLNDNVYLDNDQDAFVTFLTQPISGNVEFGKLTTVVVHDGDDVIGEADIGPPENKNKLIVVDQW